MEERDPLLSEAYRAAHHPEPSKALDAAILDAARQAVARPVRRRAAWLAWAMPLSGTAVLVLGLSLLLRIQEEAPQTLREALPPPPASREQAGPAGPAPANSPVAQAERAEVQATKPAMPATRDEARQATPPTAAADASMPASSAAPESAPLKAPAEPGAFPGAPSQPMPAPVAAEMAHGTAHGTAHDSANAELKAESAARTPRLAGSAAPAPSQSLAKSRAAPGESPQQTLETIRRLLRDGRIAEARKALAGFRERNPDYVLPEDLQRLADSTEGP